MMIWDMITTYGDPVVLPALTLLVLVAIIGLICNRSRRLFYIWVLKTSIKVIFISCGLLICYSTIKYSIFSENTGLDGDEGIHLLMWFWSVMGCAFLYLVISFIAFVSITITEIKQKYNYQPPR